MSARLATPRHMTSEAATIVRELGRRLRIPKTDIEEIVAGAAWDDVDTLVNGCLALRQDALARSVRAEGGVLAVEAIRHGVMRDLAAREREVTLADVLAELTRHRGAPAPYVTEDGVEFFEFMSLLRFGP